MAQTIEQPENLGVDRHRMGLISLPCLDRVYTVFYLNLCENHLNKFLHQLIGIVFEKCNCTP
jgi:hypothetical protein